MDTLPTKPEINREKEDKKSGVAGFFSRLMGGGSGTGSVGAGGFGGVGGAGAAGGLLATKAGIIGLVLIGTTVAGGVGVVGYKVFGPGSEEAMGSAQSLFEARPASERADASGGGAAAGGVSNSLQFLADANNRPAESADGAVADGAAAGSAAEAPPAEQTVTASGSSSHMGTDGKANSTGAGVAAARLSAGKLGGLSKNFSGGGSGASSGAGSSSGGLLASSKGTLSAMNAGRGGPSAAAGGGKRALASRKAGGALRNLYSVKSDHSGKRASSQAHGSTYDGSAGAAGSGIGAGSDIAGGGQGQGAGVGDGTQSPQYGSGPDDRLPPAPPGIEGENATPWQKALNTAMMMIVGSLALCWIASKVADTQYGKMAAIVLGGIAAGMAAYAMKLGMDIGGGQFGQPLQGGLITVAAGFALLNSGLCIAGGLSKNVEAAMNNMATLMKLAGGAAMLGMAVAFLKPMKTYPASQFENGKPPDGGFGRAVIQRPADMGTKAPLEQYLASGQRAGRAEA